MQLQLIYYITFKLFVYALIFKQYYLLIRIVDTIYQRFPNFFGSCHPKKYNKIIAPPMNKLMTNLCYLNTQTFLFIFHIVNSVAYCIFRQGSIFKACGSQQIPQS